MQPPCPQCGFVSDRPARFCRQCGNALFAENDATSATTRNYAPNQAPPTDPNSPYPSVYAQQAEGTPGTSKFYQPPITPQYQIPEQKKSRAWIWILVTLLCLMSVGVGIAGWIISEIRSRTQSSIIAPMQEEIADRVNSEIEKAMREAERGMRQAERDMKGIPPIPPPPPPPGETQVPSDLKTYQYPNSNIEKIVSIMGNNVIKMTTSDNMTDVSEFYRKIPGLQKIVTRDNNNDKKILYQKVGSPSIIIQITPNEEGEETTQIVIIHTPISIPKVN